MAVSSDSGIEHRDADARRILDAPGDSAHHVADGGILCQIPERDVAHIDDLRGLGSVRSDWWYGIFHSLHSSPEERAEMMACPARLGERCAVVSSNPRTCAHARDDHIGGISEIAAPMLAMHHFGHIIPGARAWPSGAVC